MHRAAAAFVSGSCGCFHSQEKADMRQGIKQDRGKKQAGRRPARRRQLSLSLEEGRRNGQNAHRERRPLLAAVKPGADQRGTPAPRIEEPGLSPPLASPGVPEVGQLSGRQYASGRGRGEARPLKVPGGGGSRCFASGAASETHRMNSKIPFSGAHPEEGEPVGRSEFFLPAACRVEPERMQGSPRTRLHRRRRRISASRPGLCQARGNPCQTE
jgi:hypothetical protein